MALIKNKNKKSKKQTKQKTKDKKFHIWYKNKYFLGLIHKEATEDLNNLYKELEKINQDNDLSNEAHIIKF